VHFFAIATLKVKLKYDFESIKNNTELLTQLKSELYSMTKKFKEKKKILGMLCVCIGYLVTQAQWPNFIEEIIKSFSESLETIVTAFKILKELVRTGKDDDVVISDNRRQRFYREMIEQNAKVLGFLDKWVENINKEKIPEDTAPELKLKFLNGVSYSFIVDP